MALEYPGGYLSFTRQLHRVGLRPPCEACADVKGRDCIEIAHPAGEELQWNWFHRRAPWGGMANILRGSLAYSVRMRGVLAEGPGQAFLIDGKDWGLRRLGGTPRVRRTDRLATVIVPGTREVQASFASVAKYYWANVEPWTPHRSNRKGVDEGGVKFACGRWWQTRSADTPGGGPGEL